MWVFLCLKGTDIYSGKDRHQCNKNFSKDRVSFCRRHVHIICSQQAFVLTSVLHLPYFKMPLSRKKYLCREKEGQWENEMQEGWYATSLTASLMSLTLWSWHTYEVVSLFLTYVVDAAVVRCWSSLILSCICVSFSSSQYFAIFLLLSPRKFLVLLLYIIRVIVLIAQRLEYIWL